MALASHIYKAKLTELKLFMLENPTVQLSDSRNNLHKWKKSYDQEGIKEKRADPQCWCVVSKCESCAPFQTRA